jgi:hypothetical protein
MPRLASLAVVLASSAALALTPGCAAGVLAVPPAIGAVVGLSVGAARDHDGPTTVGDAVLGALVGVAADIGFLVYLARHTDG